MRGRELLALQHVLRVVVSHARLGEGRESGDESSSSDRLHDVASFEIRELLSHRRRRIELRVVVVGESKGILKMRKVTGGSTAFHVVQLGEKGGEDSA